MPDFRNVLHTKLGTSYSSERTIRRAQKALGLQTGEEVVRSAIERVAEMEEFWPFKNKTKRSVKRKSFAEI